MSPPQPSFDATPRPTPSAPAMPPGSLTAPQATQGAGYVPELITLAARAQPMNIGPVLAIDTTTPLNLPALLLWLQTQRI